jgi:hypothetical protein
MVGQLGREAEHAALGATYPSGGYPVGQLGREAEHEAYLQYLATGVPPGFETPAPTVGAGGGSVAFGGVGGTGDPARDAAQEAVQALVNDYYDRQIEASTAPYATARGNLQAQEAARQQGIIDAYQRVIDSTAANNAAYQNIRSSRVDSYEEISGELRSLVEEAGTDIATSGAAVVQAGIKIANQTAQDFAALQVMASQNDAERIRNAASTNLQARVQQQMADIELEEAKIVAQIEQAKLEYEFNAALGAITGAGGLGGVSGGSYSGGGGSGGSGGRSGGSGGTSGRTLDPTDPFAGTIFGGGSPMLKFEDVMQQMGVMSGNLVAPGTPEAALLQRALQEYPDEPLLDAVSVAAQDLGMSRSQSQEVVSDLLMRFPGAANSNMDDVYNTMLPGQLDTYGAAAANLASGQYANPVQNAWLQEYIFSQPGALPTPASEQPRAMTEEEFQAFLRASGG